jgi:hypothetical protein
MKLSPLLSALAVFCVGAFSIDASAQMKGASGPKFNASTNALFGDHQQFSADLEFHSGTGKKNETVMFGKMSLCNGRSRFEMNMADTKSPDMSKDDIESMKEMGMDRMVNIYEIDKNVVLLVYPGLKSYTEMQAPQGAPSSNDCKTEITKLGEETIDGHSCIKNKVVVTTPDGKKTESTVWNAVDLKGFPVRIESLDSGTKVVMLYKNISFATPDKSLFEAPAGYTHYANMQTMMQTEMMKRMQSGQMGGDEQ